MWANGLAGHHLRQRSPKNFPSSGQRAPYSWEHHDGQACEHVRHCCGSIAYVITFQWIAGILLAASRSQTMPGEFFSAGEVHEKCVNQCNDFGHYLGAPKMCDIGLVEVAQKIRKYGCRRSRRLGLDGLHLLWTIQGGEIDVCTPSIHPCIHPMVQAMRIMRSSKAQDLGSSVFLWLHCYSFRCFVTTWVLWCALWLYWQEQLRAKFLHI